MAFGANEAGAGRIDYAYDATWAKLSKRVTAGGQESVTEYAGAVVYRDGALDYVALAGGYLEHDAGGRLRYVYRYSDHDCVRRAHRAKRNAQSSRLSFSDTDGNLAIDRELEIKRECNYYPFGLEHRGYNNVVNGKDNPIAYNGKERQNEMALSWLDYGARNYDPAIGRWVNVDPLAGEREAMTPYNYVQSNPLSRIDPDGALDTSVLYTDDIIFTNNEGTEIARIRTNDELDTYVSVDTDITLPSPIEIDARTEEVADAVGINFEWSITVGGGAHGGTGFVYFMNGENEGSLFNYDYKGGNVGLGEGFGIGVFASEFNEDLPSSLKSVSTFEGKYNGYEASYGVGGYSYSWSNRKNTSDQIYPGVGGTDNNPWTWKNRSLGGAAGIDQASPKFQARYFGGKSYDFTQINLN